MNKKMKLLLIAGGTASGKTTIAKSVWESVSQHQKVNLIQLDDYYFPFSYLKEKYKVDIPEQINWDDPIMIDFELLKKHLNELAEGKKVKKAKFIYQKNEYSKDDFIIYEPTEYSIVEGIHSLYESSILELAVIKIYVHADSDIRLIRRIRRDAKERYEEFDSGKFLDIWEQNIRTMHNKYIEPQKYHADLIISTNNWIERKFNLRVIDLIKDSVINDAFDFKKK